jgi:hypothetical protein
MGERAMGNRNRCIKQLFLGIGCLSLMGLLVTSGRSEDPAQKPAVQAPKPAVPARDVGKYVYIEPPARELVAARSATVLASDNPKVKPGLVKWHANFAEACEASKKSGKPVLLFQMMGKLDDQFC